MANYDGYFIVLLAADGLDNCKIAELVGVGRIQVGRCASVTRRAALKRSNRICRAAGASLVSGTS